MPPLLPLLTDRSKRLRASVVWYLRYLDGYAKYVPLDRVARAVMEEKDPGIRRTLEELMCTVLDVLDAGISSLDIGGWISYNRVLRQAGAYARCMAIS